MLSPIKNKALIRNTAYVDGQWIAAQTKGTFSVHDPATGNFLAEVPHMDLQDTENAVHAAKEAFQHWSKLEAAQRAGFLRKWHQLIVDNADDLAYLLTMEQGKPLAEAKAEILYGASFVEWFAEEARRVYGDIIPGHQANKRILVLRQPIGVVAAITPWNFPNAMITRKIAPALAAGCTIVLKPAEDTPLSALALAALAEQAGFPAGVINVLTTKDPEKMGNYLCKHPDIRKISFTGSTEVGKWLFEQSASTLKKLSLELGGNAPFIVFDDANVDDAVEGAIASKYRNAGQTCVCANRILVQEGIYEAFVEKFTEAVKALKVGIGTEENVVIGPLIHDKALEKVQILLKEAVDKGAKIQCGGNTHSLGSPFFDPTVISEVTQDMAFSTNEIFGPVAPIYRFKTDEEAIELANATSAGLAAYFYARDLSRVWKVAEALEYGIVGVNSGKISTTVAPFGGVKESGFGREGSKYGIDEYTVMKYLCLEV